MKEPKIRFKGFSGEWKRSTLGDLALFSKGSGYSKSDICKEGTPVILYGRMYTKYQSVFDEIDTFVNPKDNSVVSKGGEVIIPGSGESSEDISLAAMVKNEGVILGGDLNILKFNQKVNDPAFMSMAITYSPTRAELSSYSQGKTVVHLRNSEIAKGTIRYPNISEQNTIVNYVLSLDAQISASTSRLASLKQMKAASLQAMFPQEGETMPKVRFKGFEGEWNKAIVGKIGYTYSGLSGKSKDDFGTGNAQFITFMNVLNNAQIDTSIFDFVEVRISEHQNEVRKGDLFFNTSSETPEEVGLCAVLKEDVNNVYLNSFCFGFRLTDDSVYPSYIAYLMRSNIGRHIMSILAQGATRYNLSKNNFCQTEIPMPCKKEQQSIASFFTSLDRQIALHAKRLEKLKQIKATCLDKMFV